MGLLRYDPETDFKVCFDKDDPETLIIVAKHIYNPPNIYTSSLYNKKYSIDHGIDVSRIKAILRAQSNNTNYSFTSEDSKENHIDSSEENFAFNVNQEDLKVQNDCVEDEKSQNKLTEDNDCSSLHTQSENKPKNCKYIRELKLYDKHYSEQNQVLETDNSDRSILSTNELYSQISKRKEDLDEEEGNFSNFHFLCI